MGFDGERQIRCCRKSVENWLGIQRLNFAPSAAQN